MTAFPSRCGIPSECYGLVPSVPGVTPRAGMQSRLWRHVRRTGVRCRSVTPRAGMQSRLWGEEMSQRDTAYQRRVKPWIPIPGGGGGMSTDIRLPHRGNAYQPRATLWVCHAPNPRVLKERRISPNDGRVPDQPLCGVPSERIHLVVPVPRVSPWAGMHGSVGAENPAD